MSYYFGAHAIPCIIVAIGSGALAFYTYFKNPASDLNRLFALLMFSLSVFAFGQGFLCASLDPATALFWARFKFLGMAFFAPLFVHSVLAFSNKDNPVLAKVQYLYLPSAFLLVLPFGLFAPMVRAWHDFDFDIAGPTLWGALLIFLPSVSYASYVLGLEYSRGIEPVRRRIRPLLLGALILLAGSAIAHGGLWSTWLGPATAYTHPFLASAGLAMSILFAYVITRYEVLEVPPAVEIKAEAAEPALQPGMVVFTDADRGMQAFLGLLSQGYHGLVVTKHKSEKVREEMRLEKTPVVSLDLEGKGGAVDPRKLDNLFLALQDFAGKGKSAVLVEDLNYLLSVNSLKDLRAFLASAVELFSSKRSVLILELDEEKMNQDVLAELKRFINYQHLMPVFSSLANPIRKDIVLYLEAGKASFTEIYKASGVLFPSKLSFHLNFLKDSGLVEQDEEKKYFLTWKGRAALEMMREMEEELLKKFGGA